MQVQVQCPTFFSCKYLSDNFIRSFICPTLQENFSLGELPGCYYEIESISAKKFDYFLPKRPLKNVLSIGRNIAQENAPEIL